MTFMFLDPCTQDCGCGFPFVLTAAYCVTPPGLCGAAVA